MVVTGKPPLAAQLELEPHPEGGWYRQTWASPVEVAPPGYDGARASATAIYFLLMPGEASAWHVVRSDELWLWHRGGPLTLQLCADPQQPGEPVVDLVLGPDVETGQVPQAVVPGGVWQAAAPATDEAVLVSCIVSPGFDFADFAMIDS